MHDCFVLDKIKADVGPSWNASTLHTLSLCFLCVFVAQSQKSDLIASVLAGKLIPQHPGVVFCCVFEPRPAVRVKRQGNEPGLSITLRPSAPDVQPQWVEELKQQKNYLKLLKKQSKELKELRKKHLKKVRESL